MRKLLLLGTLVAAATSGTASADEPAATNDVSVVPIPPTVLVPERMSEDQLASEVSERLIEGVKSVDSSEQVRLLAIVSRLRPFGYGIVTEASESGGGRGGRGGSRGRGGSNQGAPAGDAELQARFDSFDRDRDGVWTAGEINSYMSSHPASGDGKVTFEEFKQAWADLRSGRGTGSAGGRRGRGGSSAGGPSGRHGGGASGRHGGGGHGGHGPGSRPSASERASEDAKYVLSWDANRDRTVSADEIRSAVEQDVHAQLNPTTQTEDGKTLPVELSDRGRRRTERRLLTRAAAIRAALILSSSDQPRDTVDQSTFRDHFESEERFSVFWESFAGGKTTLPTKAVYSLLLRADEDSVAAIR